MVATAVSVPSRNSCIGGEPTREGIFNATDSGRDVGDLCTNPMETLKQCADVEGDNMM